MQQQQHGCIAIAIYILVCKVRMFRSEKLFLNTAAFLEIDSSSKMLNITNDMVLVNFFDFEICQDSKQVVVQVNVSKDVDMVSTMRTTSHLEKATK